MHSFFSELISSRCPDRFRARGNISRWLSECAVCGSFLPPIVVLCSSCWPKLISIAEPNEVTRSESGLPFKCVSPLLWTPETAPLIRPTLHAFKGGTSYRLAREMVLLMCESRKLRSAIFIPAPSSKKDHAFLLAKAASSLTESGFLDPLEAVGDLRRQRDKSKEERSTREFQIKADMVNLVTELRESRRQFIFIDDVITTGATVLAAHEALGKPKKFEAWSLARRPRLASYSGL